MLLCTWRLQEGDGSGNGSQAVIVLTHTTRHNHLLLFLYLGLLQIRWRVVHSLALAELRPCFFDRVTSTRLKHTNSLAEWSPGSEARTARAGFACRWCQTAPT